jgi:hypothetical protein
VIVTTPRGRRYTVEATPDYESGRVAYRVDGVSLVCDEPDCRRPVACGSRTRDGYRTTCSAHAPVRAP